MSQSHTQGAYLPAPPPEAAAASARLRRSMHAEIEAAGGHIPFERYMELALYAPGLGYYTGGAVRLGEGGDFVTAPELSPLYARCLARQAAEVLRALGGADVLEVGAGSGAMAAELLQALERHDALPDRYLIVDRSPELARRQRHTLEERVPRLAGRVGWLERLPDEPMSGVFLANEVLDAFPVARFRIDRSGGASNVETLEVASEADDFAWVQVGAGAATRATVAAIERELGGPLPHDYVSEYCPALVPWVGSMARALGRGLALLVDYGLPRREYYLPERRRGTLICHYRQRAHDDPFRYPGLQDITAWVDFTAVAEAAVDAGLELAGFTTQAHFLIGCGVEQELAGADRARPQRGARVARQAQRLLLPGEMGERFRVMGLARDYAGPLSGFSGRDLRRSL